MNFINAFLICGAFCLIAQLILDIFKLMPIHVTLIYVIIGAILEGFGLYEPIIEFCGAGAMLPISSFGHSVTSSAIEGAKENGLVGIFQNIFAATGSGISFAIFVSFIMALIFKPRG